MQSGCVTFEVLNQAEVTGIERAPMPDPVRATAIVLDNGEVMWPFAAANEAITSLAAAGRLVLGLDLRSDGPQSEREGLATQIPLSAFKPSGTGATL